MKVLGLAWLGSNSPELDGMTELFAETLGLPVETEQLDARVFRLPDGSAIEVFKPTDRDHAFFDHPVAGILVDDVRAVRDHMVAAGIEFVGDVHMAVEESWAKEWSHFRAPDGFLYVLVSRPELTAPPARQHFQELRICLRVDDIDAAIRLYRDGLGLDVVDDWTHPEGQRGVLLAVTYAAIELFDNAQWELVDDAETGVRLDRDHALRVEVADVAELRRLAVQLAEAGAETPWEVVETPWEQTCQRVTLPGGEQLSISVLPAAEAVERASARRLLRPTPG